MNTVPTESAKNILLVGNKTDLAASRQVELADAERLASELGLAGAIETSAKEGSEILNDIFYIPVVNALDQIEQQKIAKDYTGNINGLGDPVKLRLKGYKVDQKADEANGGVCC